MNNDHQQKAAIAKTDLSTTIGEIMISDVHSVTENILMSRAAKVMAEKGIRHLVVTDVTGGITGVFSVRDLVRHTVDCLLQDRNPENASVRELMVKDPTLAQPSTTIVQAASILASKKIGCLPVADDCRRLLGIVTVVDLLHYLGSGGNAIDPVRDDADHERIMKQMEKHLLDFEMAKHVYENHAAHLALLNDQLAMDKQQAEESARVKSDFLSNMSHEIRTPMTAILGFSEVLAQSMMDREQRDAVSIIKRNGEYLIGIINNILDLSKIENGKLEVECIQCSLCQILSETIALMRVGANAKNLSLEIEYDGPIPRTIQSDPTRLKQILINLTSNSIKFTKVGKIRLVVRLLDGDSDEPKIQIEVVDSGIGMTDEQVAKLFNPFQQAETSTTRKFGGTGLGLAISKRLAGKLGGDIAVKTTLGVGSTFTLTVGAGPLDGVELLDDPTEDEISTDPDKKPTTPKAILDCRVLLAEDNPDTQRLLVFLLKKAGAEVTLAENGQIAHDLALAARDQGIPFDVILMDMQMPVMDGYDATANLREAGYTRPIIALTAHAMSTDRDKSLNAGCDDYATKPIDREQLISLVAQYAFQRV